jgi:hypothetical protein
MRIDALIMALGRANVNPPYGSIYGRMGCSFTRLD